VDAIRTSIRRNGFYGTLVAQRSTGHIVVGNHRFMAAVAEGMETVPVHWLDCDDATARRILVADNRSSDLASYDERELAQLLESLASADELAGALYSADDVAELLATSGIAGDRNVAFLDDLVEGADTGQQATDGGEVRPIAPTPRELVIAATADERAEIVERLNRIRRTEDLPTMTAALLWALRECDPAD
jgi:ParB-like chromosome segregation protein Spo0J